MDPLQPTIEDSGGRETRAAQSIPNHAFTSIIKTTGPTAQRYITTSPVEVSISRTASSSKSLISWNIPLPPELENAERESFRCDSNIGYLFPPIVGFSFGDAEAQAFVGNGQVLGIYLVEPGKGYSPLTPPAKTLLLELSLGSNIAALVLPPTLLGPL